MQPGAPQPRPPIKRRRRFLRPLIATLVLAILLTGLSYVLLPRLGEGSGFGEREFKLGSTTFHLEFDDDETDDFFQHESWDSPDLSTGRRITIGLPRLTVKLGYEYEPLEAIRARLPSSIAELTDLLDSKNHVEVFAAAYALYERPKEAVTALPNLLVAAERNIQVVDAIAAIAHAAPNKSMPTLISGLSSTNPEVRLSCVGILTALGTNSISALTALNSAYRANQIDPVCTAFALNKIAGDCSITIPALSDELINGPPDLARRTHILRALTDAGPDAAAALPEVLTVLKTSAEPIIRGRAIDALSHICADQTVLLSSIEFALASAPHYTNPPSPYEYQLPPPHCVVAAINALGRLGPTGVQHLIPLYQGTNIPVKTAAARALAKIGPLAISASEAINTELQSSRVEDVSLACHITANLATNATPFLPTLTNLLFVPNIKIRAHAAITLTHLGHHNDTITRILADSFANHEIATQVFKTVQPILKTNAAFKAVFDQRLSVNRKAAQAYRTHAHVFTEVIPPSHFCSLP